MDAQGPGRRRVPSRLSAEDDALNQIAREAEARLAAKRAARAEAREIRMKELERQQKEIYQVQKKYYGLESKWGHIEQWMEDSERYSHRQRTTPLASEEDELLSVGSRGSRLQPDLEFRGPYSWTNGHDAESYAAQALPSRRPVRPSEHGGHLNSCSWASSARASPLVEERPDKEFAEKGARHLPGLSAATLASLGGTSSRRGSGDTSVSLDTEASIREMKDSLVEAEDKYRKAMVSNAQLDNEKTNFMYQVDALKDLLLELEEQLAEAQRRHEDKSRELEREKQAHSALRFQFAEVKEALKQRDEMLEKHGIILHSEAATSRETPHTPNNGSCPGPSSVTEEELNALKATGDGTLGRAEAAVAEVGSKFLPGSEQERPPEAPEEPVLPPAQDHTSAASEDGAPSPGTLDRAPAPDAASPDSAAEAEPRGARTPPGAGTGTSPESDGCGGASRDPEAGQGGGQASPSETLSEGVTEEQEGGSPGGAVAREPPESQRAGSTDGGPGAGVEGSPANPTSDMQENQGAGCGGHVASGPAGQEEEERGAITPQELAPSGDPPGAHGEEKSEPCGTVPDSSQKSKNRKKKNRKKKAAAAAADAAKGAEKQLSFESTGSSHAEEDAQGTPGREPGAGAQGQGAETTAQHERADCPEDPSPERDGRDGPGTRDSDTGEATADGDTVSCVGQGAESPATSRAVSSGDGGEEGTSRGHGVPPESEDELDDQGPWEDAVDGPPLEGVAGLSQPVSRQGLESISLDSEDLSPDGEPEGLRPQGQQEAGGGSEMGKSKEDCALC